MKAKTKLWFWCAGCFAATVIVANALYYGAGNSCETAIFITFVATLIALLVCSAAASNAASIATLIALIATGAAAAGAASVAAIPIVIATGVFTGFAAIFVRIFVADEDSLPIWRALICVLFEGFAIWTCLRILANKNFGIGTLVFNLIIGVMSMWPVLFAEWAVLRGDKAVKPMYQDKQHCLEDGDPGLGC